MFHYLIDWLVGDVQNLFHKQTNQTIRHTLGDLWTPGIIQYPIFLIQFLKKRICSLIYC